MLTQYTCYTVGMNTEVEAKFLNVNHDALRAQLRKLGATLEQPMRTMKRVVIHTEEMAKKNAFVRIRDEGYRTTITYKQFDTDAIDGAKEHEIEVSDFDEAIQLLAAAGLTYDSFQESRRENWRLGNTEIMLDEWPWLQPYIEIEGESEHAVRDIANQLGFTWGDAVFGGIANAYRHQYPHIGEQGNDIINQQWSVIKFSDPLPHLLADTSVR